MLPDTQYPDAVQLSHQREATFFSFIPWMKAGFIPTGISSLGRHQSAPPVSTCCVRAAPAGWSRRQRPLDRPRLLAADRPARQCAAAARRSETGGGDGISPTEILPVGHLYGCTVVVRYGIPGLPGFTLRRRGQRGMAEATVSPAQDQGVLWCGAVLGLLVRDSESLLTVRGCKQNHADLTWQRGVRRVL